MTNDRSPALRARTSTIDAAPITGAASTPGLGDTVHTFPFHPEFEALLLQTAAGFDGQGTVSWISEDFGEREASADGRLLAERLFDALRIRDTNAYPGRSSYQGNYYCVSTSRHVWHESLLEGGRVASLDAAGGLLAIAAQPMLIQFADGTKHFPDYLAQHSGLRQVLYDVKPAQYVLSGRFVLQTARTLALCRRVGWGYAVLTSFPRQAEVNFSYLTAHHHPDFRPDADAFDRLAERCATGAVMTIGVAAAALRPDRPAAGMPGVLHLLWNGTLATDLAAAPLTSRTPVAWRHA